MKRVRHSIGSAEYQKLTEHTLADPSLRDHSRAKLMRIFTVLYYTGIRVNEITEFTIGKLRELLAAQEGVIHTSKKDKERMLWLSDEACEDLKELIESAPDDRAYISSSWNKPTTPMHPLALIRLVNGYMKKVLGSGYTSHSFRQGLITEMFAQRIATATVQHFIGHEDPATTIRYAKPTGAQMREALVR